MLHSCYTHTETHTHTHTVRRYSTVVGWFQRQQKAHLLIEPHGELLVGDAERGGAGGGAGGGRGGVGGCGAVGVWGLDGAEVISINRDLHVNAESVGDRTRFQCNKRTGFRL